MGTMKNLIEETIAFLSEHGKTPDDVRWVGDESGWCSWEAFAAQFKDFTYDPEYGGNEVNMRLLVVGETWWLERHEYEGLEWWEYKTPPRRPDVEREITHLREDYTHNLWGESTWNF